MTNFIRLLVVFLLATSIAWASVVPPVGNPARFNPADTMRTVDHWNPTVVGIYTWVNTYIVGALNKLTAKGDMYIYDGSQLQKLAVGANTFKLVSRSSSQYGVQWENYTGENPRTTKGDLIYYDGAGNVNRLPVGVDGQVLTIGMTSTPSWSNVVSNPFPVGAIVSWSPAAAGTTTIPTGWTLCDGTSNSPNLIGLFVIGTKPIGSSSSASPGGFGAYTPDTQHGSNSHTHSGGLQAVEIIGDGSTSTHVAQAGSSFTASTLNHTHTANNYTRTISAGSGEPADYALVYIMKL